MSLPFLLLNSGGAPAFVPTDIAGCQLWLRADLGITIATGVSGWADQSGTGDINKNAVQVTGALQPTLNATDPSYGGKPTLSFASVSLQSMRSNVWTLPVSQPYTVFVAGNDDGLSVSQETYIDNESNINGLLQNGASGSYGIYAGAGLLTFGTVSNAPRVLAALFNNASSLGFSSAKTASGGPGIAIGTFSKSGLALGSRGDLTFPLNGKIAEVIVYGGDIGATNRGKVFDYLGARYGIVIGP